MGIRYKEVTSENVDFLEGLCNELMAFQAEHAKLRRDVMASMTYRNRLKPEYAATPRKHMIMAYDGEKPIGFAYANVTVVDKESTEERPGWAMDLKGEGFYPSGYPVPKTVGTFKLLYVEDPYRNSHVGWELTRQAMDWLNRQEDAEDLWVYVANGNEAVGRFYERFGFAFSHFVFDGFVLAYTCKNNR